MSDGLWAAGHRMRKVDLGSREFERELVSRLTSGKPLDELAKKYSEGSVSRAMTALVHAGIIAPVPLTTLFANLLGKQDITNDLRRAREISTPQEVQAADLLVVASDGSNEKLADFLVAGRAAGMPVLGAWLSGGASMAFAYDDGISRPCIHCALMFDASSRSASGRVDAFVDGRKSRFDARAVGAADRAPLERLMFAWLGALTQPGAVRPTPGRALALDASDWKTSWEPYSAHPSCDCVGPSKPTEPGPASWEEARRRRFTPVVCVDPGGPGRPARALFRQSRRASEQTLEDFGVTNATGENATLRAFAEGVERFCMLHAWPDVAATPRLRLEEPALDHDGLVSLLFRDEEYCLPGFRHPRYSTDLALDWSWATELRTGQRVLVPTCLIGRPSNGTPRLVDASSNGYAAHTDKERATQLALLEVIERDAVLRAWYLSRPMPVIGDELSIALPQPGVEVRCFLASSDVDVPVVLAVARLPDGSLRAAAAAEVSFSEAWRKAGIELLSGLEAINAPRSGPPSDLTDPTRRDGPLDQLKYYLDPERTEPALAYLWSMNERVDPAALVERWPQRADASGWIREAMERAGWSAWVVDRSLPDVFGSKWHVVRVLVPGAVEISWGQPYRRLASPRITGPLAAGAVLNPMPHVIA
jgi:thiazole/oxazole-forming peptide maturase SagD family component